MRDIPAKQDNVGDTLPAAQYNSSQVELENAVSTAGISLDPADGPDNNLEMLSHAMGTYATGMFFSDDRDVDADLIPLVIPSSLRSPLAYFSNMRVSFLATHDTLGGTVQVNVSGIGAVDVVDNAGTLIDPNRIKSGDFVTLAYRTYAPISNRFELMPYFSTAPTDTIRAVHRADYDVYGGDVIRGQWHTRTLNGLYINDIGSEVTVGDPGHTNELKLPAGTYDYWLTINGWNIEYTIFRLYNVTAATTLTSPPHSLLWFEENVDYQANVTDRIVLTESSYIRVETWSSGSGTQTNGQGDKVSRSGQGFPVPPAPDAAENIYLDWMLVRRNHL